MGVCAEIQVVYIVCMYVCMTTKNHMIYVYARRAVQVCVESSAPSPPQCR